MRGARISGGLIESHMQRCNLAWQTYVHKQYQNIGVGVLWSRSCRLLYLPVGLEQSPDQRALCKTNYVNNNPSLVKFEIFFLAFFFFLGGKNYLDCIATVRIENIIESFYIGSILQGAVLFLHKYLKNCANSLLKFILQCYMVYLLLQIRFFFFLFLCGVF